MPMLAARNVWRFYGRKPAVKGLDLVVERGSAYGFIGPNGAGKSTTLRMLAAVDRPDAGRVFVDGKDTQREVEEVRRRLGFMPDPFALAEGLSVEQYLEFYGVAYRLGPAQRRSRIEHAIELTRIGPRRRDRCDQLSKGWGQRVQLAKTLINDPALLLLDEPASGLDPAARIELREIVKTLRELGKTIVVSSHILTELADFCDAVGIIEHGRMLVTGRIDDILERLSPSDVLVFEVLGAGEPARALLLGRPGIAAVSVERGNGSGAARGGPAGARAGGSGGPPPAVAAPDEGTSTLRVTLQGRATAQARAELLRMLISQGVEVAGLATTRVGLEELFLKVAGTLDGRNQPLSAAAIAELLGARPGQEPR